MHGVYKPGNVKLRPEVLKTAQEAVVKELGLDAGARPFDLVFHGGSGSTAEEIGAAVDFGVVKMNVDTDTQYAFTRPVAGHMFANYDGVLKVDGEVGNKKAYDPRAWGKAAEAGMAARVVEACENLRSTGHGRLLADALYARSGRARRAPQSRSCGPARHDRPTVWCCRPARAPEGLTALTVAAALTLSCTAITTADADARPGPRPTAAPRPARPPSVGVMTRNIYLGVDGHASARRS